MRWNDASRSPAYAGRAAYAALIGYAAGYDPADLAIRGVFTGLSAAELATIPGATVIREVRQVRDIKGQPRVLVETARCAKFDAFLKELGRHPGAALGEVAGNHRILVTIVVPQGDGRLAAFDGLPIFSVPIQSRSDARRIGVDVPVRSLVQDVVHSACDQARCRCGVRPAGPPAIVASDGALLDAGRFHVTARTGAASVGRPYAAGAWFVLPVMGKGLRPLVTWHGREHRSILAYAPGVETGAAARKDVKLKSTPWS